MAVPTARARPPHHRFWRGQVWPRRGELITHWHAHLAVVLGLAATIVCSRAPVGDLEIDDIAAALLSFAALAFGACITGAVLALTQAPDRSVRRLAENGMPESEFTHFSDLVFAFTYSAVAQLALVVVVALSYLLGGDIPVWPSEPRTTHVILLFLACTVGAYSLIRLFNVVSTLSALAVVLVHLLGQDKTQDAAETSPATVDALARELARLLREDAH